jgi:predicted aconitase with swiveling domain
VVKGRAEGEALVASTTLSFWGEVDPMSGRVIASGHPLEGQTLRGKVLVIESTKGSSATPLVMGLCARAGNAPVAIINANVDALAALGCVVHDIPLVVPHDIASMKSLRSGDYLRVDADGETITVIAKPRGSDA